MIPNIEKLRTVSIWIIKRMPQIVAKLHRQKAMIMTSNASEKSRTSLKKTTKNVKLWLNGEEHFNVQEFFT